MRVYLFRGKHPLYETLVNHPPEGVEYLPMDKGTAAEEYTLYGAGHSTLRGLADGSFSLLGLPRMLPVLRRYDLVHSGRGFLVIGPNRYVVDLEHASSFAGMHHERMRSIRLRRTISKFLESPKCGGILPHCEAAKKTLSLLSHSTILQEKSHVVYPAVSPEIAKPRVHPPEGPPVILFMGEYYWKGGREVIEACRRLAKSQDFVLLYISLRVHPPPEVIRSAESSFHFRYIEGPIPRKRLLEEVYPASAIFAMPTSIDTFGYAFMEAMSFSIPCIGTYHFAVPEIVEEDVSGILVHPPVSYFDETGLGHPELRIEDAKSDATVDEVVHALDRLLASESLRSKMGAAGLKAVTEGKFSISRRNSLLKDAYESARG